MMCYVPLSYTKVILDNMESLCFCLWEMGGMGSPFPLFFLCFLKRFNEIIVDLLKFVFLLELLNFKAAVLVMPFFMLLTIMFSLFWSNYVTKHSTKCCSNHMDASGIHPLCACHCGKYSDWGVGRSCTPAPAWFDHKNETTLFFLKYWYVGRNCMNTQT